LRGKKVGRAIEVFSDRHWLVPHRLATLDHSVSRPNTAEVWWTTHRSNTLKLANCISVFTLLSVSIRGHLHGSLHSWSRWDHF